MFIDAGLVPLISCRTRSNVAKLSEAARRVPAALPRSLKPGGDKPGVVGMESQNGVGVLRSPFENSKTHCGE
jgi:hypothetical protein